MSCSDKNGKDLLKDMEEAYSPQSFFIESDRRDVYYSALVKDIVNDNRTSQILKCCFFGIVCIVFLLTCIGGMIVIFNVTKKDVLTVPDVGVAFAGFGSVLSAIVVLPKIIAKHLFPEDSEKVRFDFIKENQKSDQAYLEDDIDDADALYGKSVTEVEKQDDLR